MADRSSMGGLASAKMTELKNTNESLWRKIDFVQRQTKRLYAVLLQYPQEYDEAVFHEWECAYHECKSQFYRSGSKQ